VLRPEKIKQEIIMEDSREAMVQSWSAEMCKIMFELMAAWPDCFTADEFYELCANAQMPRTEIKRLAGAVFRRFQAEGHIEKTATFKLSKRNGSSPLPVWKATKKTG
jgi:hypothetical protein